MLDISFLGAPTIKLFCNHSYRSPSQTIFYPKISGQPKISCVLHYLPNKSDNK